MPSYPLKITVTGRRAGEALAELRGTDVPNAAIMVNSFEGNTIEATLTADSDPFLLTEIAKRLGKISGVVSVYVDEDAIS